MALGLRKALPAIAAAIATLAGLTGGASANYIQTDLVSDLSGLAQVTDAALVNPWGLSYGPGTPVWVSDQGTNLATLYAVTSSLSVTKASPAGTNGNIGIPTIPPPPPPAVLPQGPTGQVFNSTTSFVLNGAPARFIFANLNGTISAWNGGQTATLEPTTAVSGAIYTGLAIGSVSTSPYLYAANGQGNIQVFDGTFANVTNTTFAGKFVDPNPIAGYVPFNVQAIGNNIYVTYAPAGRSNQQHATPGQGYVDVYDTSGNFIGRLVTGGALAAPWGVALAPAGWGQFGGDLLVGNFSYDDSIINAFDPMKGTFEGSIPINLPAGTTPGGLWGLEFGGSGNDANPFVLFFADGIDSELHGLFGAITVSEPPGLPLVAAALGLFGIWRLGPACHRRSRPGARS